MDIVTVVALYDENLNYHPGGQTYAIPVDSLIQGTKTLPTAQYIAGTVGIQATADMLKVKTANYGVIYLNMTLAQYNAAIQAASLTPPIEQVLTLTVPTNTPAGTTVTNSALFNAVLINVSKNGANLDLRTISMVNSGTNGVVTLPSALVNTDVIAFTFYTK